MHKKGRSSTALKLCTSRGLFGTLAGACALKSELKSTKERPLDGNFALIEPIGEVNEGQDDDYSGEKHCNRTSNNSHFHHPVCVEYRNRSLVVYDLYLYCISGKNKCQYAEDKTV